MESKSVISYKSSNSSFKSVPKRNLDKIIPAYDTINFENKSDLKIYPPIRNEKIIKNEEEKKVDVRCQVPNVQYKYKELIKKYDREFRLLKEKEQERIRLTEEFNKVKEERNQYQHLYQELNIELESLKKGRRRSSSHRT